MGKPPTITRSLYFDYSTIFSRSLQLWYFLQYIKLYTCLIIIWFRLRKCYVCIRRMHIHQHNIQRSLEAQSVNTLLGETLTYWLLSISESVCNTCKVQGFPIPLWRMGPIKLISNASGWKENIFRFKQFIWK